MTLPIRASYAGWPAAIRERSSYTSLRHNIGFFHHRYATDCRHVTLLPLFISRWLRLNVTVIHTHTELARCRHRLQQAATPNATTYHDTLLAAAIRAPHTPAAALLPAVLAVSEHVIYGTRQYCFTDEIILRRYTHWLPSYKAIRDGLLLREITPQPLVIWRYGYAVATPYGYVGYIRLLRVG